MSNKYYWHSRISEKKFRQVVRCFAQDVNAAETARRTNLTRKSINTIYLKMRRCIYDSCRRETALPLENFKSSGCYFAAASELPGYSHKPKGKASALVILLESGQIQTDIIYASSETVLQQLETKLHGFPDRTVIDFGFADFHLKKNESLYFGKQFSAGLARLKSIHRFLFFAEERLKKFKGITRDKFLLHLRESEWRFNNGAEDLYKEIDLYPKLLELFRNNPI